MEEKPSEEALTHVPKGMIEEDSRDPKPYPRPPNRRRGAMHFIKVALFMMKNHSEKPKGFSGSRSLWRKLVGSVRPLQLQLQQSAESSPPSPEKKPPVAALTLDSSPSHTEFSEDALFSPSAGSSRSGSDSPYASALGLSEMVQGDAEAEESDSEPNEGDGDMMIDAKAEEFIANFYHQMMLQRQRSMTERI